MIGAIFATLLEATAAIPGLQAYIGTGPRLTREVSQQADDLNTMRCRGGSCLLTPTSLLEACEAF